MNALIGTIVFIFLLAVFLRIDTNIISIKEKVSKIEEQLNSETKSKKKE